MVESTFSYAVSRPYPFRWFTPVALVGGTIALVLFSLLNFASSGFELSVEYVADPNSTVSNAKGRLKHWPSYFTHQITPTCQAEDIQVNTEFFTNQSALSYTLNGVWSIPQDGSPAVVSPALTYSNNLIENCQINGIQMELEAEDRSATQYGWNQWGETLQGFITCSILTSEGTIFFNLTTEYDFVPPTAQFPTGKYDTQIGLFSFITRNATTKTSLWWGESLLSQYWSLVSWEMQTIQANTSNNLRKGTIHFTQPNAKTPFPDITSFDFWTVDYRFITNTNVRGGVSVLSAGRSKENQLISSLANSSAPPNIWVGADSLAKSFYSTIMTDLGQVKSVPNILTNATALQYFSQNITSMQANVANSIPGPARDSYEALKERTGPLGTSPSVISTKYLCQVPLQKSTGPLFISILVADLVFMQALWKLFTLCTEAWVKHKDPQANSCTGCESRSLGDSKYFTPKPEKGASSVSSVSQAGLPHFSREPNMSLKNRHYSPLKPFDDTEREAPILRHGSQ